MLALYIYSSTAAAAPQPLQLLLEVLLLCPQRILVRFVRIQLMFKPEPCRVQLRQAAL
jgi:hypothetical protein